MERVVLFHYKFLILFGLLTTFIVLNGVITKQLFYSKQKMEATNKREKGNNIKPVWTRRSDINCEQLIKGNETEIKHALNQMDKSQPIWMSSNTYINKTKNCQKFKQDRGYLLQSVSKEEEEFPVAFSIIMYGDVNQAERLLRAIYRPQNVYCIHVDKSSNEKVKHAMFAITKYFDNVFMTSKSVKVEWGQFSLLEPEIICMKELWNRKTKWKYYINLTGHEFPLKTNFEMIQILKVYNGANDVEGTIKRANSDRWQKAGPAPRGIKPVKGNIHVVINRNFVDFILHNKIAKDLLEWVKTTEVPDETFFSTLNHNPQLGIQGSYKGIPETDNTKNPYLATFINWVHGIFKLPCRGKWRRSVCVFGIGDLQILTKRRELFANKLFWNFQPFALDCLEEWHWNKTNDDFKGIKRIDTGYYANLDFVKNSVLL